MFGIWGGVIAVILNGGYTLIEIEEEPVPLAALPEAGDGYFKTVVAVMIIMMLVWMAVLYFLNCYKCRTRIRQLTHDSEVYLGWRLTRLRETVEELELQEAEELVDDMEKIFIKNVREVEPFLE